MLCKYPFWSKVAGGEVPCGQCHHCRHNARRIWAHRIFLEARAHALNLFVTLTYNEQHLVFNNKDPVLYFPDVVAYLDRLRHRKGVKPFRYFLVGEYGDKSQRPHYHIALFGIGLEQRHHVEDCWSDDLGPIGHVHIGSLTWDSASYIAGYVNKKMTKPDDPRLEGRDPEKSLKSLRPGIGATFIDIFVEDNRAALLEYVQATGDVPQSLNRGGKSYPLGRYLVRRLRKALGVDDAISPRKTSEWKTEMQVMRSAREDASHPAHKFIISEISRKAQVMLNRETISAIRDKEKKL